MGRAEPVEAALGDPQQRVVQRDDLVPVGRARLARGGVHREERRVRVDNDIPGMMDEELGALAFKAHPFRWPVIGWMKDIKAVTETKAIAFYRRHYTPDNAVVVIAGRVDPATALQAVTASYGGLAPSRAPVRDDSHLGATEDLAVAKIAPLETRAAAEGKILFRRIDDLHQMT